MKLISCDEVGNRIAGYTVRDAKTGETRLVKAGDHEALASDDSLVWASPVELIVWLSRSPEFWGDATTSARFRVWDRQRGVVETTVPRRGLEAPIDRWDLV